MLGPVRTAAAGPNPGVTDRIVGRYYHRAPLLGIAVARWGYIVKETRRAVAGGMIGPSVESCLARSRPFMAGAAASIAGKR